MRMKRFFVFLFLAAIIVSGRSQDTDLKSLLPDSSSGWQFSRDPECYEGDELFDLINGGADLFHEYHFNKVINAQYTEDSGSKIQVEIYEMDSDSSAYGIFSSIYNTAEVGRKIGLYSVVNEQYLAFVKDKYYVNIAWVLRREARKESLLNIANLIDDKISFPGKKPYLVSNLCKEKCVGIPIYFMGNLALSNIYYFDFKDPFQIEQGIAFKDTGVIKIVFVYNDEGKSQDIFSGIHNFIETSKRFQDPGIIYQGFTCSDNKGNRLVFRQGTGFITVLVALKPDIQLMTEQEVFFNSISKAL